MAESPHTITKQKSNVKGILKHGNEPSPHPEIKWDEMNILETFHPANKDYGHMKIDEPPTPYSHEIVDDEEITNSGISSSELTSKLIATGSRIDYISGEDSGEDEDENLTLEAKHKKDEFKQHRRNHYNEFQNVRKARELIEKELAEIEKEEDENKNMDVSN
ncbi:protein phosphatase inhibitor 2 [Hydra vulgaris]|uniref:Protein phosphatase inhibitor 2 n=1 Tax=Hydra vulgaris TaxID=6087 RepID=T2MGA4_HYDVU|nr:protein phosphatase inhibitor 2 [Hydra vulgaris]